MPQVPIRKVKRATVLTKRTQCLRKYYRERSYRPLYEKLKSNNNYLAKALSNEKENNQSLFTQNLALIAEIQELRLGYNAQENVITNVLSNAKEMLKMLVTMSGYMTNTISICQEYVASNTTVRLSSASSGRKDSSKRLSTKSPAKGVVKPMVSGHTITKPTINLSRVNMENINNLSRLSDIPEVSTPDRTSINRSQINADRSSISVPMAITPLRYENSSTRRMPERLVPPPRINDPLVTNDERRLKRRSHHSKKLSGSFSRSRSGRWSDETPRNSTDHINQLGSPTVKLNDVSKLLQNSHSINIKRLIDNVDLQESHDTSETNIIIPETQVSINLNEQDETRTLVLDKNSKVETINKVSDEDLARHSSTIENVRSSQNNIWEDDPLEGPSWLFNNTLAVPSRDNEPEESNHLHVSDFNNNTSDLVEYEDDDSSLAESNLEELSPLDLGNVMESNNSSEKGAVSSPNHAGFESYLNDHNADNNLCELPTANLSTYESSLNNMEDNSTNVASFVTLRRGPSEAIEEETEDFTLMLTRQPIRNMHFDINELRLPILEEPITNSNVDDCNAEEITISNIMTVPMSNQDQDVLSEYERTTMKIPLVQINNHESIPEKNRYSNKKELESMRDRTEYVKDKPAMSNKAKHRSKSKKNRDPSTAKVVLEKLNESHIKRISSADETELQDINNYMGIKSNMSNQTENLENTEDNMNNNYALSRPRRRKAPTNLKEPNVKKKLRRSK